MLSVTNKIGFSNQNNGYSAKMNENTPSFKGARLSYGDALELITQRNLLEKGESFTPRVAKICQEMTGQETVTPGVIKKCSEALNNVSEVFGRVSESIGNFFAGQPGTKTLDEAVLRKQKTKILDTFGRKDHLINVPAVKLEEGFFAKEAKATSEVLQQKAAEANRIKAMELAKEAAARQKENAEMIQLHTLCSEMTPRATRIYNAVSKGGYHSADELNKVIFK